MTATMTWIIEWMQTTPTTSTPPEVVLTAGWRCNGAQTENAVQYGGTAYGTCSFPMPAEGGQFTPYADLTQDQVLGWCWANGVDQAATESAVATQIANAINPPVVQPPLPWSA